MKLKFNSTSVYPFCLIFILLICVSCKNTDLEYHIETQVNPFKISPLTAMLQIKTGKPCRASFKVLGESPIEQSFDTFSNSLEIPVVGLYPDITNKVVVTLNFEAGQIIDTVKIKTEKLPKQFPTIEIDKLKRNDMELGLHACDIHFANHGKFNSIPLIFDDQGKVRWYLDLSFHSKMVSPFQRLKDGNILMVGRQVIYEFDMLGKILKQTRINNNYGMHHDVLEIENGNLLICVGKRNAYINIDGETILSDSDFIMLYDRENSKILKEWDLAKHLDVSRNDLNFFRKGDWIHINGLAFDENDRSIIVSGKNQGLIKILWNDELEWIMTSKKNWGKSGRDGKGFETKPFLLTAVNSEGKPFSNAVQLGNESVDDFDFPWGPHAPELLPNGNILVFDNGTYRNYNDELNYSRAVEYNVNESDKTVEQIWQYGKKRGLDFFSSIVSDVDFLSSTNNILITSGFIMSNNYHSAKIIEVDYVTGDEVFEATLYFKNLNGNREKDGWGQSDILYRSERLELKY